MTVLRREWFSIAELAGMALPGIPTTKPGLSDMIQRLGWQKPEWKDDRWRDRQGQGGGTEYHYSLLPLPARIKLTHDLSAIEAVSERDTAKRQLSCAEMWSWFERLPDKKKDEAKTRLGALDAIRALTQSGLKKTIASVEVAREIKVSLATLYGWEKCVQGIDRADYLPYLAPRHAGRAETVECDDTAWEMLRSDYLRPEQPNFTDCYSRMERAAKKNGWTVPSARTLERRIADIPEAQRVLAREGVEALKRLYPAQERDRGVFHALEGVNTDGHEWDLFVKWPNVEKPARPVMIAFQDLYSGLILSWRVDRVENKECIRLAFGDMVESYGIPDHCWMDNGRSFASKWLTGGTPNRYRFKVKDDDPLGVMTQLGVNIHWTTPYHGQSKPIERVWKDFCGSIAKHPAFAGAYTGNNVMAKPENYASSAVPLDVFLKIAGEEIAEFNARVGRRTPVCLGRSFLDTFNESYAKSPIKKATFEQQRLWLLAAEAVGTAKVDGSVHLFGNRYWADFLIGQRGQKVTVRFDPQKLRQALHVYRLDGAYLGSAPCVEATGFNDVAGARTHARARNDWARAEKAGLKAQRTMTAAQVAALALSPAPEGKPRPPETKVVRLIHRGGTALQPVSEEDDEIDPHQSQVLDATAWMNRVRTGSPRLVATTDGDD